MQTIIIVLDPGRLANPDADLRYRIPERIEEVSNGAICDNGYDYVEQDQAGPLMAIWLHTEQAQEDWNVVLQLLQNEKFLGNDLSESAQIYISENESEEIENSRLVYPASSFIS